MERTETNTNNTTMVAPVVAAQFQIDEEIWRHAKAAAMLKKQTVAAWVATAIAQRLEREPIQPIQG